MKEWDEGAQCYITPGAGDACDGCHIACDECDWYLLCFPEWAPSWMQE